MHCAFCAFIAIIALEYFLFYFTLLIQLFPPEYFFMDSHIVNYSNKANIYLIAYITYIYLLLNYIYQNIYINASDFLWEQKC